jgi:hypothetical protein
MGIGRLEEVEGLGLRDMVDTGSQPRYFGAAVLVPRARVRGASVQLVN